MPRPVPPRTEAVGRWLWRHRPRRPPNYRTAHGDGPSAPETKLRILADIDRATETRGIGAILRREGLYSSTLSDWRRQRDAGAFSALVPGKRGPKTNAPNPLSAEVAALQRNNARLTQRLARAEAVIDIQKKVAALLGIPLAPTDGVP